MQRNTENVEAAGFKDSIDLFESDKRLANMLKDIQDNTRSKESSSYVRLIKS